ncbi:MAG: hypothetical protein V4712_05330 [Pseudomonadota bacterium]
MKTPLLIAALLALAAPAYAGTYTPPEGCTMFMTVQSRACRVSNHYTCAADAPGDQWRADFDQEGIFFQSQINSESEWIQSLDLPAGVVQRLVPGAADPASFSELLSSGLDTFDFGLTRDNGEDTRVTGFDRLTGKTWVIDGVTLSETEFEFTETDMAGNILRQSNGKEYINPQQRLFFSGPSNWNGGDGEFLPMDGSPMQFINPGEPGFGATQPIFDCDAILSSVPKAQNPAKEALSHDNL